MSGYKPVYGAGSDDDPIFRTAARAQATRPYDISGSKMADNIANGMTGPNMANLGGGGGNNGGTPFFSEGGGAGIAISAVQTLGELWSAYQSNKMAKKQFAFNKDVYNTNLGIQKQQYNTSLSQRAEGAAIMAGNSKASASGYIQEHSL